MENGAMITYKQGDVLMEDAEALVNTVNCVGVAGRGVALQFKRAYPENFKSYQAACRRGDVQPGRMMVFETKGLTNPRFIINFPTKRHWRGRSRMIDIEAGLADLVAVIGDRQIESVAIPPLGSGLGGLAWADVRQRIEDTLSKVAGLRVVVFEPLPEADSTPLPAGEAPSMTPGRAALVGLVYRYLGGLLDPFASLLEVHKLMYFMQEAGEPLRLRFSKGPYGPYAQNLRHVLQAIEGYYMVGYMGADRPNQSVTLVPGAFEEANAVLADNDETRARFGRVAELVDGFETPHGLELLATVHWVVKHEGARGADNVVDQAHAWSARKRRFSPSQLTLALHTLEHQGWLQDAS
jgi:O-acetyl-ADP-ribose deacetylase (regulator of RNase III)